ncbi:MAG TPA: OmpA family protein [Rhodopila sp.]|nr:OmpA family protein [Rhodopila sp.]
MAQPITGYYVGAGAGLQIPQNTRATELAPKPSFGTSALKLNEGYGFNSNFAVGYGLGNGFRFELEGNFDQSNIRSILGTPGATNSKGNIANYGLMANAYYDLDVGLPWIFPYIGAGAGYQWSTLHSLNSTAPGFFSSTNSSSGAFAWQAIIGASFPVPNMPGLSLTADYRFMNILGGENFHSSVVNDGVAHSATMKLGPQFDHELVFGVRYAFNTPSPVPPPMAPAPVAVPAPAPARSYLVFFDWDKADLTERARSIVREAADNSTHVQVTRIEVNGYTDTSGKPAYNQGLSMRRAQVVAAELVRDGVPRNAIAIQGFGDTHLLVATGPGVREPQNRRVEIIIH